MMIRNDYIIMIYLSKYEKGTSFLCILILYICTFFSHLDHNRNTRLESWACPFRKDMKELRKNVFYRINLPGRYYFFCYHDNKGMFAFVTTKKSWHEKYNSLWVPFCLSFLRFEPQSISKNILFNSYMRRRSIYSTEGRICQVTYFVTTLLLVQIYFFRILKRAVRINLVCH